MKKSVVIRLGLLLFALINQTLLAMGYNTLPVAEGDAEVILSTGFTVVTAIIAAIKDNPVKKESAPKSTKK